MVVLNQTAPFLNKTAFNSHHLQPSVCTGVTITKYIIYFLKCTDPRRLLFCFLINLDHDHVVYFREQESGSHGKFTPMVCKVISFTLELPVTKRGKNTRVRPPASFAGKSRHLLGHHTSNPNSVTAETPWSLLPRGVWSFNKRSKVTVLFKASFHFRNEISLFSAE